MSTTKTGTDTQEPLRVSILTQRGYLVASIHTALDDSKLVRFQCDLMEQIGGKRARGVIITTCGLALEPAHTALDLEEGTALLDGFVGL
jgi:hypothetical protein